MKQNKPLILTGPHIAAGQNSSMAQNWFETEADAAINGETSPGFKNADSGGGNAASRMCREDRWAFLIEELAALRPELRYEPVFEQLLSDAREVLGRT